MPAHSCGHFFVGVLKIDPHQSVVEYHDPGQIEPFLLTQAKELP
jgi:hypothetical protein